MSDHRKENQESEDAAQRKDAPPSRGAAKRKDAAKGKDAPEEKGESERDAQHDAPSAGQILVAFEKLFGGGRGVQRFSRSGLRHVKLGGGAVLVEQNPRKSSEWAQLAREGRRVSWLLHDGEYLARVVDGELTMLD
ncbi:MAG TPA: hypothetical protein VGB73_06875 [Pyrinomonadaceae bacterium]|jgi:hypothetical protein